MPYLGDLGSFPREIFSVFLPATWDRIIFDDVAAAVEAKLQRLGSVSILRSHAFFEIAIDVIC